MIALSRKTRNHLVTLFRPSDVEPAEAILVSRCGGQLPGMPLASSEDLERVRFAALRLSKGRLPDLDRAVALAETDWRDLLVAAGFADDPGSHDRWTPNISKAEFYAGKVVDKVLWYLHDPDLPAKLIWARLRVFSDGSADSTFADGPTYGFDSETYAAYLLTEDEYRCFSTFDDEDERDTGIRRGDVVLPHWSDAPERAFEYLGIY